LAIGSLAAVVLVIAVVAFRGSGYPHHLYVTVPDATDALAGQPVKAAGQTVGQINSIEPVQHGRAVRLELALSDAAWPLPSGSRFALRWGGTISYSNRFVALTQGPPGNPPLQNGQVLPTSEFGLPVEFDQFIGMFTPRVRGGIKSFFDHAGSTFRTAQPDLRAAITAAPPALTQASYVFRDLDANQAALDTLITSSDRVISAANRANPDVGHLIAGAAATFAAVASQAGALQQTLSAAPSTLIDARATLAHANTTLNAAGGLLRTVSPGVQQLQSLASPLDSVLQTLVSVGPDAITTLQTARIAAPRVIPLLGELTHLMPTIQSIGQQSVSQLNCVRPYTPDIVAFFSNWADWLSATDHKDRFGRANAQTLLPASSNASTETSGQAAAKFPGLRYGFPRPPGANAGQPWFLPQCGAGPDALNPAKDPEARPYNPLERMPNLR
jgi:ABC-type transporter Mla subunit MlaD